MKRIVLFLSTAAVCVGQTCDAEQSEDVSPLVRVYRNAMPDSLQDAVMAEAMFMASLSEGGKAKTIWMSKDIWGTKSENEQALSHMVRRLYEAEAADGHNVDNIAGAELWVHHKPLTWKMGGPHFDKDEVSYNKQFEERKKQGVMSFPLRGTVTYLSNCGGPTVIFNQTMSEDLSALIPEVPQEAAVMWPEVGKHITFAGNAYHQVRGDANLNLGANNCTTRTTLLVNWWDHQVPGDMFNAEWVEKHSMPKPPTLEDEAPLTREQVSRVDKPEDVTRHTIAMFPTTGKRRGEKAFHFTLPKEGCCGKGCVVRWADEAIANVPLLDATNLFVFKEAMTVTSEKPSVFLFQHADEFRLSAHLAEEVEKELGLNVYAVDVAHSPGVLGLFGLSRTDVPTAGIFDGKKTYTLQGGEMNVTSIKAMVEMREGGKGLGDPYKNTIDIDTITDSKLTPATLDLCLERGMERLMLTSRGMRTNCAFLLPGKDDVNLAKFKRGLTKWEQKANVKAWETFVVSSSDEELLTSRIADVPTHRPLFAVIDPEFMDVISWPAEDEADTSTSVQFAEWLALVDKARLKK